MRLDEYEQWYRKRYRRTSSALTAAFFITADIAAVMLCFGAGFFLVNLYDRDLITFRAFVRYWPYLPAFIIVFGIQNLYPGASLAPAEEFRHIVFSSLIVHTGIILGRFIYYRDFDSISAAFLLSLAVSFAVLLIGRSLMRNFLSGTGLGGIPAVIYGAGHTGRAIVDRLLANKGSCYIPVLILDDDTARGDEYQSIPIIHDTSAGPEIVRRIGIKMAIVAMPELNRKALDKLINSASAFRYNVLIPDFFRKTTIWMSIRDLGGILGFATSYKLNMFWNVWLKRFTDLFMVTAGGLLISPLLLWIALLIKLSSPGPVLYKHKRLGKNGKTFYAYKFRSMTVDADNQLAELLKKDSKAREEWDRTHKLKNDPRITTAGRFLRKTSLDELPQLINIIKGDMSLVGPRPIVKEEIKKYGEDFNRIFSVTPGLTGLWQVSGRSDTDYGERISLDTYYLQSWSVWLDFWIIYKTIGVVLRGRGAY